MKHTLTPNIRIRTSSRHGSLSFPLSPVAGTFEVLDHNSITRPTDSIRIHNAAISAGMTHTYTSRTFKLDRQITPALIAAGWESPKPLGSKQVHYDGGKRTAYIFGTRKA